jgi:hypothetical protein
MLSSSSNAWSGLADIVSVSVSTMTMDFTCADWTLLPPTAQSGGGGGGKSRKADPAPDGDALPVTQPASSATAGDKSAPLSLRGFSAGADVAADASTASPTSAASVTAHSWARLRSGLAVLSDAGSANASSTWVFGKVSSASRIFQDAVAVADASVVCIA